MPQVSHRYHHQARADGNRPVLLLMVAVAGLAAAYLTWRIPAGVSGTGGASGRILLATGLVTALIAVGNARRVPDQKDGWFLIGGGSLAWSGAHFLRSDTEATGVLIYSGLVVTMSVMLIAGCLRLAGLGSEQNAWRHLTVDLVPPIVMLLTVAWLVEIGPFVRAADVRWHFKVAGALHGVSAVALIVLGLVGMFAWRQLHTHPAVQSVLAGLAIIATADAFWLQQWINHDTRFGVPADAAFCIGFATIAIAGLQARLPVMGKAAMAATAALPHRLTQHSTPLSLIVLLCLAGGQARWGELTSDGIEVTAVAGLIVLIFAMMWEDLMSERETVLTGEIDTLSERIDGLISQVGRDPLTGLLNRRAFQERLEHEIVGGRVVNQPVAIALIDVDNFKQVNDTFGHAVGDQVLQAVASVLIGACRASDIAARYAGDEFVMIFPGVDEHTASQLCQRISESVRRINDQLAPASGVAVTLSVGVAVTYRCKRNVAQLVAIADAAMYDAKESGKDRVVAVDADTLMTSTYWGANAASSALAEPWQTEGDRRSTAEHRTAS